DRRPRLRPAPGRRTPVLRADGPDEGQTATAPARRPVCRADQEEELLVLPEQDRRGRLEGRQPAAPLRLREREDPLSADYRRLPAPPATDRRRSEARTGDGPPAVRGRGPRGAAGRPARAARPPRPRPLMPVILRE